jgi:hypothetical protein
MLLVVLPTLISRWRRRVRNDIKLRRHTRSRIISIISKRHVGRTSRNLNDVLGNLTTAGAIAKNELDTHADTSCAGANWSLMSLTGEICDVNPFLASYQQLVQEIPVARPVLHRVDRSDQQH